jgi:hypothetical protein
MYNIRIVDQFRYHASVVFGLDILAPSSEFPLLVGCSLQNKNGEIIDVPARWLLSPGLALWQVKVDSRLQSGVIPQDGWHGRIIFALWRDDRHIERLADTGWVNWECYWLIGSSTKGLDMQDDSIKSKYGDRMKVWKDGRSS